MRVEGGCHCGAVRYAISGAPLASMVCHCRTCQRISGAPVMAWVSIKTDQISFISGRPGEYPSSAGVLRQFCSGCGTQLTYRVAAYPDELDVATASLDDPEAFPPSHHSWLDHNIRWVRFGDGLPQFPGSRTS